MINILSLTKTYGKFRALYNINLNVLSGQLFGFLGPNGAGKTTTIKIMTGLIKPTKGTVLLEGVDIIKQPVRAKQKIGVILDRPYLYEKITGREFLMTVASIYGVDKKKAKNYMYSLFELFDLIEWQDELIESYSHGMKQKVIISAALIHDPPVIIVDEPVVGLDPESIKLIKEIFRAKVRAGGTVFMSTHVLDIIEEICDSIAIINKGQIYACGDIEGILRKYGVSTLEEAFLNIVDIKRKKEIIDELIRQG